MTKDYFSAEKFPLSTQEGLDEKGQILLDAYRYDLMIEDTEPMTEEDKALADELKEKYKMRQEGTDIDSVKEEEKAVTTGSKYQVKKSPFKDRVKGLMDQQQKK